MTFLLYIEPMFQYIKLYTKYSPPLNSMKYRGIFTPMFNANFFYSLFYCLSEFCAKSSMSYTVHWILLTFENNFLLTIQFHFLIWFELCFIYTCLSWIGKHSSQIFWFLKYDRANYKFSYAILRTNGRIWLLLGLVFNKQYAFFCFSNM